eukprot:1190050-Prorocentrum_minimum.AAC.8
MHCLKRDWLIENAGSLTATGSRVPSKTLRERGPAGATPHVEVLSASASRLPTRGGTGAHLLPIALDTVPESRHDTIWARELPLPSFQYFTSNKSHKTDKRRACHVPEASRTFGMNSYSIVWSMVPKVKLSARGTIPCEPRRNIATVSRRQIQHKWRIKCKSRAHSYAC